MSYILPKTPFLSPDRLISIIISLIYLIIAVLLGGESLFLRTIQFLIWPLALIWFGDDLGNFTGTFLSAGINRPSKGCFLTFLGWVILSLPIFWFIYLWITVFSKNNS